MTTQHSLFLNNGALGDKETPFHLRKLCDELANIIERNEEKVQLDWDVPTYPKARKRFEQMLEEEGDDVNDATGDGEGDPGSVTATATSSVTPPAIPSETQPVIPRVVPGRRGCNCGSSGTDFRLEHRPAST